MGSLRAIYRSADASPLLVPVLALVAVTNLINSERTTALTREYGAATTGVLFSLEICFAWGMALLVNAAGRLSPLFSGLGNPFSRPTP